MEQLKVDQRRFEAIGEIAKKADPVDVRAMMKAGGYRAITGSK